ncbi:unnamed protein product, partial [Heterotrigona itama]
ISQPLIHRADLSLRFLSAFEKSRSPFRRLLIAPGHYVAFAGSSPIRSLIKRETPQGPLAIHHAVSA